MTHQLTEGRKQGLAEEDVRVNKVNCDTKGMCERVEREGGIGLQQLCICENAHLADVEAGMRRKEA